jgi:hypothetical protein
MTINSGRWVAIEIWADTSHRTPYILMLVHRENGVYEIVDPKENYKVVFSHTSYDEAKHWLGEDEFDPISEPYRHDI